MESISSNGKNDEGFADEGGALSAEVAAARANEHAPGGVSPSKPPQTEALEGSDIKGWGFSDPRLRPFVVISIAYLLFTVTDVSASWTMHLFTSSQGKNAHSSHEPLSRERARYG